MSPTPFQQQQAEEAAGRNQAIIGEDGAKLGADPVQTPIDDSTGARFDEHSDRRAQNPDDDADPQPQERRKPLFMSPQDEIRQNIAKRFVRKQPESDDEDGIISKEDGV